MKTDTFNHVSARIFFTLILMIFVGVYWLTMVYFNPTFELKTYSIQQVIPGMFNVGEHRSRSLYLYDAQGHDGPFTLHVTFDNGGTWTRDFDTSKPALGGFLWIDAEVLTVKLHQFLRTGKWLDVTETSAPDDCCITSFKVTAIEKK